MVLKFCDWQWQKINRTFVLHKDHLTQPKTDMSFFIGYKNIQLEELLFKWNLVGEKKSIDFVEESQERYYVGNSTWALKNRWKQEYREGAQLTKVQIKETMALSSIIMCCDSESTQECKMWPLVRCTRIYAVSVNREERLMVVYIKCI